MSLRIFPAFPITVLLCVSPLHAQDFERPPQTPSHPSAFSTDEIRHYAEALVMISQVREAEKAQAAALPGVQSGELESQLHERVSAILQRFDLDRPTFNHISARVETDAKLRQRVQQSIMAAQVGV